MKTILVSAFLVAVTLNASAMEQCDSTSKSEIAYESADLKITFIQGDIAKQAWEQLSIESVEPKPDTFGGATLFYAQAKYSESLNCWRYQPSKSLDGVDVGAANCEVYSCNVIERR